MMINGERFMSISNEMSLQLELEVHHSLMIPIVPTTSKFRVEVFPPSLVGETHQLSKEREGEYNQLYPVNNISFKLPRW